MSARVRLLIVDDSPVFAQALAEAARAEGGAEVVGIARDGAEAVELARRLAPDVISMDVYMPGMDGLEAVERIMDEAPAPIVLVTSAGASEVPGISFRAIGSGALDVLGKPSGLAEARALVSRLCLLARVKVAQRPRRPPRPAPETAAVRPAAAAASPWTGLPGERPASAVAVVGIAISTGGPPMLEGILRALPRDYPAGLAVVQHLSPGFAQHLVDWLRLTSGPDVRLAQDGGRIEPGVCWIAPAEAHLLVRMGGRIAVDAGGERVDGHRPSGTVLLHSLARVYGSRAAGVVMTGMGQDGAAGLLALRQAGGWTAAQDAATSAVDGMPRAARENGAARVVLALADVPAYLLAVAGRA